MQKKRVDFQDLQRRLVAGLVAYVAMLQQGSVRVQLQDGKGKLGHNARCNIGFMDDGCLSSIYASGKNTV